MPEKRYYATGKRKTAVARVWIRQGSGEFLINGRPFEDYFPVEELRLMVNKPLMLTNNIGKSMSSRTYTAAGYPHRPGPSATASPRPSSK